MPIRVTGLRVVCGSTDFRFSQRSNSDLKFASASLPLMETFIARQPIFDTNISVYGYELLHRSSSANSYDGANIDQATLQSIADSYMFPGHGSISEGKFAFINFTRSTLIEDCAFLLPPETTVIELLESVRPDADVLEACRKAKDGGYRIALDDYDHNVDLAALTDFADVIKVDFLATTHQEQQQLADQFKARGKSLLAEKVETWEDAKRAEEMGYTYFQGYFFGRPVILTGSEIPASKLRYLTLIREMHQPELPTRKLEKLIREDLSLTYKLLRFLNSAAFGLRREIGTVRQAIVHLGEQGIRKWITLIALVQISNGSITELVNRALMRASMCESMARSIGQRSRSEDLYLLGLFSCLDAILGRSLADVLEELGVTSEMKVALLDAEGLLGEIFRCTSAYESGNWEEAFALATKLGMEDTQLPEMYRTAVSHATEVFSMTLA
jgi:c-di-GMP-related signal transduction protein